MSLEPLRFRKSSFSQLNDCVQWAHTPDAIHLADSKTPEGPTLRVSDAEWTEFTTSALAAEPAPGRLTYHAEPTGVTVFLTTNPELTLTFTTSEWTAFTLAIATGEVHQPNAA